jgi:hypothetical protein
VSDVSDVSDWSDVSDVSDVSDLADDVGCGVGVPARGCGGALARMAFGTVSCRQGRPRSYPANRQLPPLETIRMIRSRKRILTVVLVAVAAAAIYYGVTRPPDVDLLTFHGGNARLGWNAAETVLTPSNVAQKSFGKLWQADLDGIVAGSPLFVSGVQMGWRKRDTVYAATMSNSVHAIDAASGAVIWSATLDSPVSRLEYSGGGDGTVGILSTPAIDRQAGNIYVCGVHRKGFRQIHLVWALDMTSGKIRPGWPVTLAGSYKGVAHEGGQLIQRGALMLQDGWLYIPFGGRGDTPPWHGWVMGIDTRNPGAQQRAIAMSTISDGGGVWSGGGLSADDAGALYAVTGNGEYDLNKGGDDLSQSVLRLSTAGGLQFSRDRKDYYTPANFHHLDEEDEDLGGATALVLPDLPGSSTPHLLFTGGKDGVAYLLNRDALGGLGGEMQKMPLFFNPDAEYQEGIRATSAYFDAGQAGRFIYVAGDGTGADGGPGVVGLRLTAAGPGGPAKVEKAWYARCSLKRPGPPVVTSNGARNAVVWLTELGDNGNSAVRAFDAVSGRALYSSDSAEIDDQVKAGQPFVSPTVAKGRVYVGAHGVACYGRK